MAEELNFRRASERLGIAQPALSRAIQDLESELGVTLLERSNRKVALTEAGATFLHDCQGIWSSVDQAVQNARLVDQGHSGSLRVGYTDMAIAGPQPELLTRFHTQHPGIVIKPYIHATNNQLELMDKDELDIGFVTGPIEMEHYSQHPVGSEKFVCVVYNSHPLAKRKSVHLEELANESFVFGPQKEWENFNTYLLPMCRRAGFVPKTVQEGWNTMSIIGLVACGVGITLHTENVKNYLHEGVRLLPLEDPHEELVTVAVWKSKVRTRALSKFLDFLIKS